MSHHSAMPGLSPIGKGRRSHISQSRPSLKGWLWVFGLCGGLGAAPQASIPATPEDLWRVAQHCGITSTYLMLKAHGFAVEYDRLLRRTKVGPRGSSLADLQESASAEGFALEVCRATPNDLASGAIGPLPVVVHLDVRDGAMAETGHYLVLLRYSKEDNVVDAFDGGSALFMTQHMDEFCRDWTGYVLRPRPHPWPLWAAGIPCCAGLAILWQYARARRVNETRCTVAPGATTCVP